MTTPLISICVPTHDGRRDTLAALLDSLAAQADDVAGRFEVCVSDNASADGTRELVESHRAAVGFRVEYRRHETDLGLWRNLLSATGAARGAYCWLMGSDDLLMPGALRRACAALDAMPGASGYVVGSVRVDAIDSALRARPVPRAFHPPGESRTIEGFDAILDQCGNAWTALSWNLVRRTAWERAAREQAGALAEHPVWPQVVLLAAVAMDQPHWGWIAEPLVGQRDATTFLFERATSTLADRWTRLVGSAGRAWAHAVGGHGTRWRRRMRRFHAVWGRVEDVRATKLYGQPSLRAQLRLAVAWLRTFWPAAGYWRDVLPATLSPVWLTRRRHDPAAGTCGEALCAPRDRLTLAATLPGRLAAGSVASVPLSLHNAGHARAPATGPRFVALGQRWSTAGGNPLPWEHMAVNDVAGLPQTLPRSVCPGGAVVTELALYAPPEPGEYRLEIVALQHGTGWLDAAGIAEPLAAPVSVHD